MDEGSFAYRCLQETSLAEPVPDAGLFPVVPGTIKGSRVSN